MSPKFFFLTFLLFGVPAVAAAQFATVVLPQDVDYASFVSSQIYGGDFLSDPTRQPQVAAAGDSDGLEIFLINKHECSILEDSFTFRILIRNVGNDLASDVKITDQYSANTQFVHAAIPPDQPQAFTLEWIEFAIPPGDSIERTFTLTVVEAGPIFNDATVEYTYGGGNRTARTSHTIDGSCEVPDVPTAPRPINKFAAIICDVAEVACTAFFPKLGINFEKAKRAEQQPRICSQHDPRDCDPNQPTLGIRYSQAKPDIKPGECRVAEDLGPGGLKFDDPEVSAPVETTWCESNGYPEFVIRGAPEPFKARAGSIRLPDTSDLDGTLTITLDDAVRGQVCGGKPGDPWWAPDCTCQCGELVDTASGPVLCQQLKPITRHDIFVTSQAECLLEGAKHNDPFF